MTKLFLYYPFLLLISFLLSGTALAQTVLDSNGKKVEIPAKLSSYDSATLKHSPRKAAIRSAILPGLGQAYNKKYWKIPLVYGALGTSAGVFLYNVNWYKRFRYAYRVARENATLDYPNVNSQLLPFVKRNDQSYLQLNRDEFRRNVDYSVLVFILLWGLNVVDASVDAHLKSFDVSPDLGFQLKPGYSDVAQTTGISLIVTFK